jgi:prenyltransferase beta subunit
VCRVRFLVLACALLPAFQEAGERSALPWLVREPLPDGRWAARFPSRWRDREEGARQLANRQGSELAETFALAGDWLAAHQQPDGRWESAASAGSAARDVRATALAILGLMADGSTSRSGARERQIAQGAKWLHLRQEGDGSFREDSGTVDLSDHVLATLALVELHAASPNPLLRVSAERAVSHLLESRRPDGGWSIDPSAPTVDLDATAWSVRALIAARECGLGSHEQELRAAVRSLAFLANAFSGQIARGGEVSFRDTAIALYIRLDVARTLGQLGELASGEVGLVPFDRLIPQGRQRQGFDPTFCVLGATASHLADDPSWTLWEMPCATPCPASSGSTATSAGRSIPTTSAPRSQGASRRRRWPGCGSRPRSLEVRRVQGGKRSPAAPAHGASRRASACRNQGMRSSRPPGAIAARLPPATPRWIQGRFSRSSSSSFA